MGYKLGVDFRTGLVHGCGTGAEKARSQMAGERYEWTIEWYETELGEVPARIFLGDLEGRPREEPLALLVMIGRWGNQFAEPRSASLGRGLFELRGHQVRMIYMFRPGRRILILDGMVKKRDKIPNAFLKRVRGMQAAVLTRDRQRKRGP